MDDILIIIMIVLTILIAIVAVMGYCVDKDEKDSRCCGYCTYWFKCQSRLGGRCDKHSTATKPFYTQWEDCCDYYDGFAGEEWP